jgi:hypothetical protein
MYLMTLQSRGKSFIQKGSFGSMVQQIIQATSLLIVNRGYTKD